MNQNVWLIFIDFYANRLSFFHLEGPQQSDGGRSKKDRKATEKTTKTPERGYKLIKDFPRIIMIWTRRRKTPARVSRAHQYFASSVFGLQEGFSVFFSGKKRRQKFQIWQFFFSSSLNRAAEAHRSFIYFDLFGSINHFKCTVPGRTRKTRKARRAPDPNRRVVDDEKNYNKNWSWRENNQRKRRAQRSTKP